MTQDLKAASELRGSGLEFVPKVELLIFDGGSHSVEGRKLVAVEEPRVSDVLLSEVHHGESILQVHFSVVLDLRH